MKKDTLSYLKFYLRIFIDINLKVVNNKVQNYFI
jgi:hypothetical protein